MDTTFNAPRFLKFFAVALALFAIVIAVTTIAVSTGPVLTQADSSTPGGDPGSGPDATSTPPPPTPCGPNSRPDDDTAQSITEGHYAVFDGYWDLTERTLNLNLCPPEVEHGTEWQENDAGEEVEVPVAHRRESDVDIRETVFHIEGEAFEHELTAADLTEYDFFREGAADGDPTVDPAFGETVWWLRVDDPDTAGVDEDSPLAIGFSAALLDSDNWFLADGTTKGAKPLQYEFEVIREPGIPIAEQGHVFAFDDTPAPDTGPEANIKKAFWDSSEVDANALSLYPGEYHHLQWAFTKPGTYIISVQLKGHVRRNAPPVTGPGWEPVSDANVVTSEVQRYSFQVGSLTLNKEPYFEVARSVDENSAIGTLVGTPIPVYQGDNDSLSFTLSGRGHTLFSVESDTDGNAQIRVAEDDLDHEARSEYRLILGVSDNKDHESNANAVVDSVIAVRIDVTDLPEVERDVTENSTGGTLVGSDIVVVNTGASTTYTLSGEGSELFRVERNSSTNAQIKVAPGAVLNYEDAQSYELVIHSDTDGVTHDVRVTINVLDDPHERLAITTTADPSGGTQAIGQKVVLTGTVTGSPGPSSELRYFIWTHEGSTSHTTEISGPSWTATSDRAATIRYSLEVQHGTLRVSGDDIVIRWE